MEELGRLSSRRAYIPSIKKEKDDEFKILMATLYRGVAFEEIMIRYDEVTDILPDKFAKILRYFVGYFGFHVYLMYIIGLTIYKEIYEKTPIGPLLSKTVTMVEAKYREWQESRRPRVVLRPLILDDLPPSINNYIPPHPPHTPSRPPPPLNRYTPSPNISSNSRRSNAGIKGQHTPPPPLAPPPVSHTPSPVQREYMSTDLPEEHTQSPQIRLRRKQYPDELIKEGGQEMNNNESVEKRQTAVNVQNKIPSAFKSERKATKSLFPVTPIKDTVVVGGVTDKKSKSNTSVKSQKSGKQSARMTSKQQKTPSTSMKKKNQ